MKVLIVGAGIAGLMTAYCLKQAGHDVTIIEKSPSLRTDGYVIDFFGSGYDAFEKMGLLEELDKIQIPIKTMRYENLDGKLRFTLDYNLMRKRLKNRLHSVLRSDLEKLLFEKIKNNVPIYFNCTVNAVIQTIDKVHVTLSDDKQESFDLLVGADGVHSGIRNMVFAQDDTCLEEMGYEVAAFLVKDNPVFCQKETVISINLPNKTIITFPMDKETYAAFFMWKVDTKLKKTDNLNVLLNQIFAGYHERLDSIFTHAIPSSYYHDALLQVKLPTWSQGRIVLVGDSCQAVSLLAGQGASMAVAGAYCLVEALKQYPISSALLNYENRVKPNIDEIQHIAWRMAKWFIPASATGLIIRDTLTRILMTPFIFPLFKNYFVSKSIISPK
jgi:2-polyprenyl-6-methoxyphenol hydroxylase-like FAD-dependent oxidoreductase